MGLGGIFDAFVIPLHRGSIHLAAVVEEHPLAQFEGIVSRSLEASRAVAMPVDGSSFRLRASKPCVV